MKKQSMKKAAFIPLAVILIVAGAAACKKTSPPSPAASPSTTASPSSMKARPTGDPNLMVFLGKKSGPMGNFCDYAYQTCHIIPWAIAHHPDDNEGSGFLTITSDGHLLMTVDLNDVRPDYVDGIIANGNMNTTYDVDIPQSVVDQVCDQQNPAIPHWGGPIGIQAGEHPVTINNGGIDKILEVEGTFDTDAGWSWDFRLY